MHLASLFLLLAAILPTRDETPTGEPNPNLIPADHEPSLAEIEDFSQRKRSRRKPLREGADALLRYIPPDDRARILLCGKAILRFSDPKTGMDFLVLRRCQNYYCPWCPASSHLRRTQYQAAKLASLSPTRELRVINIVWTLPAPLHALVRYDPRGIKAFGDAVRSTIARAYHYRGAKGVRIDTAAWRELGAIRNLHAIGDAFLKLGGAADVRRVPCEPSGKGRVAQAAQLQEQDRVLPRVQDEARVRARVLPMRPRLLGEVRLLVGRAVDLQERPGGGFFLPRGRGMVRGMAFRD